MSKFLLAVLALAVALPVAAQAPAAPSPAKQALINKMMELQRPGYEGLANNILMEPALRLRQQAIAVLQRVPAEKREALAKDLEGDLRAYAEEVRGLARSATAKVSSSAASPVIDKNFTEEELKQAIAILESPVFRKFGTVDAEIGRALQEKFVAETRATVEQRVRTLEQSMTRRVQAAVPQAPASAPK